MNFLSTILQIVTGAIYLFQTIRSLFSEERPFSYLPKATTIEHSYLDVARIQENKMHEFQLEIEKLFHKNQLFPRIKGEFTDEPEIFKMISASGVNEEFAYDLLVQMVLHKRANLQTLIGCLRKHFDGDCQRTADELIKAAEGRLVHWSDMSEQFIIRFGISPEVQEEIDRYQYPLPMVVEPRELRKNNDSAYLTNSGSVILRDNYHEGDVCLDHLNQVNKTKFRINQDVAKTVKNKWKNLDKPKADEDLEEYQKRVKAFDKYNRTAFDVIDHLGLAAEGEFYLTHKYDKRGRTYSQGYVVNYQGTPWNKAVIEFANEEVTQ